MANYNPYEEEMTRRRQQQMDVPQFQQPAPMANLPLYSGPEQAQWLPMGDGGSDNGQMQDAGRNLGVGTDSLLKRFRKPGAVEIPHTRSMGHVGPRGGVGPVGHGY